MNQGEIFGFLTGTDSHPDVTEHSSFVKDA